MTYFIDQLKKINSPSVDFKINLTCITFLYELFPFLDKGDFSSPVSLMKQYHDSLFDKWFTLPRARQTELCLYTSLIYFGNSEYQKAHKFLNQIILRGKNYYFLPLYRTIRLVNLMILYHLGDFDLIRYEIRSIRRDLRSTEKDYKIERFLLKFLNRHMPLTPGSRGQQWEKLTREFDEIHHDVFEQQILRIFDFTAWVESMIRKIPLSEVLQNRAKSWGNNTDLQT
jgi:hypothetical protein